MTNFTKENYSSFGCGVAFSAFINFCLSGLQQYNNQPQNPTFIGIVLIAVALIFFSVAHNTK